MSQPPLVSEQLQVGITTGDLIEVLGTGKISSAIIPTVEVPPTDNYIFGGSSYITPYGYNASIEKFDGVTRVTQGATMAIDSSGSFLCGATITSLAASYIIGGGLTVGRVQKWDKTTLSLEAATYPFPTAYGVTAAAELSILDACYSFGGVDGTGGVIFTPVKWDGTSIVVESATMTVNHGDGDAAELISLNKDYVMNGHSDSPVIQQTNQIDSWNGTTIVQETATMTLATNRTEVAAHIATSSIYMFGGSINGPAYYSDIQKWDGTTAYNTGADLSQGLEWHCCAQQQDLSSDFIFSGKSSVATNAIQRWDGVTRTTEAAIMPTFYYSVATEL